MKSSILAPSSVFRVSAELGCMGFEGLEGGVTDDVLDLAGILCGDGCVDAELGEQLRQDGVPFIDFFSNLAAGVGQGQVAAVVNQDVAAAFEKAHGAADAGLAVAHIFSNIN